jgi:hypothetical protein
VRGQNSVQRWIKKIGAFRGWASHNNGVYKQQKTILQSTIANLDMDAKSRELYEFEGNQLDQATSDLIILL